MPDGARIRVRFFLVANAQLALPYLLFRGGRADRAVAGDRERTPTSGPNDGSDGFGTGAAAVRRPFFVTGCSCYMAILVRACSPLPSGRLKAPLRNRILQNVQIV